MDGGYVTPQILKESELRSLAGSRPHDATIETVSADDVRNLTAGALTSGNEPGRSAAGGRCLTADHHFIIVIRQASDPYAGAVVNG